jgi:hypothetical protein
MDGCYCAINKGGEFNHCIIPYYTDNCKFFEPTKKDKKVAVHLEKSLSSKNTYYVVLEDTFYIRIKKEIFYELAEFLNINVPKGDKQ